MKGKAVSAFRERGWHFAVRDAEPQASESINSMERKTDTMKTYRLRDVKTVEPQKTARPSRSKPTPAPAARVTSTPALFIGLDVHNDTIAVSLAPSASTEVRRYGIIGGQHDERVAA